LLREKENNKTQSFSSLKLTCPQNPKRTPHNPLPLLKNGSCGVERRSEHGAMPKFFKTSQQNAFKRGGPHFLETFWQSQKTTHVAKVSHFPEPARNSQQKPQSKKQRNQSASSDTSLTQPCSTNRKARSMQA